MFISSRIQEGIADYIPSLDQGLAVLTNSTHSAFYNMSLQGEWGESYKRCIELPKGNPRIFGSFIEYMKTGNVKMLWLTGTNAKNVQTA